MARVELTHTFPVSVHAAFAYVTDIRNWPAYWPDFVRLEEAATARWREPGDRVTLVIRLLGLERALHMELRELVPDSRVVYISRQPGLPDARHERHFTPTPAGCAYRLVVDYAPRRGLLGLYDRFVVARSVRRAMRKTVRNLDRVFQAQA